MRCAAPILIISGFSADYLESAVSLSKPFGLEHVTTMPKPFRTAALRQYLAQSVPVSQA